MNWNQQLANVPDTQSRRSDYWFYLELQMTGKLPPASVQLTVEYGTNWTPHFWAPVEQNVPDTQSRRSDY